MKISNKILVIFIFFISFLFSTLILNRWIITDLGIYSFGRVWHYYISYSDLGFVRRALVGSIYTLTGLNNLIKNEYVTVLLLHHINLFTLSLLLTIFIIKNGIYNYLFIFILAFSPSLIIHFGYNNGSLDIFLTILAVVNILFVKRVLYFTIIIITGILIHESFLFMLPAQIFIFYLNNKSIVNIYYKIIFLLLICLITILTVSTFGSNDISLDIHNEIMEKKIPNAKGKHGLWSGYYETSSSANTNFHSGFQHLLGSIKTQYYYLIIPILYLITLLLWFNSYIRQKPLKILSIFVFCCPLIIAIIATDYYRWISMSCNLVLLSILSFHKDKIINSKNFIFVYIILLFSFFSPFGDATISRPFPIHQFILE